MENMTGKTVVLDGGEFEVFEVVSTDFALPCPVVPRATKKLPTQPDENEFARYVVKGGI